MPLTPVTHSSKPNRLAFCSATLAAGLVAAAAQPAAATVLPSDYTLLFENDFNGTAAAPGTSNGGSSDNATLPDVLGDGGITTSLDSESDLLGNPPAGPTSGGSAGTGQLPPQWDHWRPGIQRRDAINDPRAVVVGDGALTIKTWSETNAAGRLEHHSGMIATKGLFEAAYGYFEASIDFNDSPGQWSAFWMYQESIARDPSPTGATGVELDIVEHRAVDRGGNDISGQGSSNTHWNGYEPGEHQYDFYHSPDLDLDEGFHTYGLLWTPDGYVFSIDGVETWTAPNSPVSGVEQYLLLSSEVENADWAGLIPDGGYGSFEETQTTMVVDYVRVYGVGSTPVPEPATAGLIGLAGALALARRRRA